MRDWQEIINYVARTSRTRAANLGARLMVAPEPLTHNPKIGGRVPEFNLDHVRELVTVRPYRIIYVLRKGVCGPPILLANEVGDSLLVQFSI
jgi:plasmid stabilization system protein ParE